MITRKPQLKRRAATADCSIEGRISCDNAATTITAQKAKVVNKVVDNASVGGHPKGRRRRVVGNFVGNLSDLATGNRAG